MLNVRAAGAREALDDGSVLEALAAVEAQLRGRGRVVLRASGTESVVRVTLEGEDGAEVQRLAKTLADAVQVAAGRHVARAS
jgi:phosphoglucosamine mutase